MPDNLNMILNVILFVTLNLYSLLRFLIMHNMKNIFTILAVLFLATSSFGQSREIVWSDEFNYEGMLKRGGILKN